jgi:perosamine synthetase
MNKMAMFDFVRHGVAIADLIHHVIGAPKGFVPLHEPEFSPSAWSMVKECLDTGWVSSVGSYVDRFERDIAAACGTRFGVAMVNGTAALQVAMLVAGVKPGDEVIVPALTFVATANAVAHAGAVPHFVDSDARTLGMDPAALSQHLDQIARRQGAALVNRQTGRRIAAIVPMHVFGHPVEMDALLALAGEYALPVIEDAAEALGSTYKGRACGSLGRVGALSFNGNKILTTGGGGAVVTDDGDLAKRMKHLITTAKRPHRWEFDHDEVAFNYRMPNINAALGCSQLEELSARVARKRRLAQAYAAAFAGMEGVEVVTEPAGCASNYWLNALRLETDDIAQRDQMLAALNDRGIMSRPVWRLLHRLAMFDTCPRAALPVAERLETQLINIPSSAQLAT